ncbi:synthase II [Hibiscus syriacus]|uniref:beta-ketoacyl-[acyl-carrier-protein] synthase I n=1 Tax=Hibiscus syriacus TaxID=106335 RepID=A0A6A2X2S3_HIBSY|nr:3-oxoacyl-[acyl-carrier-protein] synthase II, chloroplastic-like [Hibiscus syriacus]KAE8669182.1 synthase II [Hibiscus syriacus]
MASSSLASPLCNQAQSPLLHSSVSSSSSSKRADHWPSNRRKTLIGPCSGGSSSCKDSDSVSSFCGSRFQGSMTSCLAFEPRNDYRSFKNGSSFRQNGSSSSFFESKHVSFNNDRKHRRIDRGAARSEEAMAIAVQPAREIRTKQKLPMKQRRVVVTGMGVVTPLGHDPDVFYNNLLEGASGISEIEAFDCAQFPTRIAGEIKSLSTDGWVAPKLSKRMDKFMLYMLIAGKKALEDGGVTEDVMDELDKEKCGVLIGSAMGGMKVNSVVSSL